MSRRGLPVLAPGDEIRLGGHAYRVVALDGTSAQLADVTGSVTVMLVGHLLADPGFELVAPHRRVLPAASGLEFLPGEVRASAQWWEQHLVEVLTGVPPDAVPGTAPRPEYDPRRCSLRQRELAKHAALTAAGHEVALSTLQRLRRRYELEGIWGLVDRRYAVAVRGGGPGGRVDPRVVEATRQAISEQTDRSTGPSPGCAAGPSSCSPMTRTHHRCRRNAPFTGWSRGCRLASTPSARRAPAGRWPSSLRGLLAR